MKTNNNSPKTLQEAIAYFADPERAFVYAVNLRWPDGVIACPRCGGDKHSFVKTRLLWFCKGCKKQFTVKVGTIFEDSALGLDKWMTAVWMIVNCKNGISSHELGRALGVTQKSAWFMLHRIRTALKNHSFGRMGGPGGTVGLENFWSLLKRGLKGTYVAVEPFHLDRYVDEQVFRFNNRKGMNDADRFALAMSQVAGKRLTYSELTGKDIDTLHAPETGTGQAEPF